MQRRTIRLMVIFALGLLCAPLSAHAQPPAQVHRIGVLAPYDWPPFAAFRQGLPRSGRRRGTKPRYGVSLDGGQERTVP